MAKDCIICTLRAGSREHVFPAALGSRRTNKGIYCGKHNEAFSPLAKILCDQLAAVNALLSVRPDHSSESRSFVVDDEGSRSYVLSGDDIRLARPHKVRETVIGTSSEAVIQFSNEEQAQQWLAKQRAAGLDVRIIDREEREEYFTDSVPIRLSLGGSEGLRAIGYVALTFLGHYFPKLARHAGVSEFKAYVQGTSEDQFVWWDTHDAMDSLLPNPYRFGHTVAVGVSASRGEVYARISLFSTVNFAIQLGTVDADFDRMAVVYINPQAERAPNDITEIRENALTFEVNRPLSLTSNLGEMIEGGQSQKSFQLLFNKISYWKLERTALLIFDELNSIREFAEIERHARVKQIVDKQGQRVFNLMRYVVRELKPQFESDPRTANFVSYLDSLVDGDANSSTGLSQTASEALKAAKARLVEEINKDLTCGNIDISRLSMLFGGGPGAALIAKSMLDPFLQGL